LRQNLSFRLIRLTERLARLSAINRHRRVIADRGINIARLVGVSIVQPKGRRRYGLRHQQQNDSNNTIGLEALDRTFNLREA